MPSWKKKTETHQLFDYWAAQRFQAKLIMPLMFDEGLVELKHVIVSRNTFITTFLRDVFTGMILN